MAWNGSDSEKVKKVGQGQEKKASNYNYKALIAASIVVVGAVAAWLLLCPSESSTQGKNPARKDSAPKRIEPTAKSKPASSKPVASPTVAKAEEEIDPSVAMTNGVVSALNPEGRLLLSHVTNSTGMILTTYRRADGTMVEVLDRVRPKVKKSATDQLLDMAINHPNGPPIPVNPDDRSLDEAFRKSLENKIEIKDTDSESIRELKERMIAAREEMAELMNNSTASFSEIIEAHQRTTQQNTALLNEAQSAINDCLKKGNKDGAGRIYQQFAGRLEALGVTGLTLDPDLNAEDDDDDQ